MLTAYDATTARWLLRGGVDVLLVGDSAAQVVLGQPSTIHAPLDFMLQITAGVKRGAPEAMVMGDLPFMSYQADVAEGVRNAGRMLTEGLADVVKLEVGPAQVDVLGRVCDAGVPGVAHLGWRPQRQGVTGVPVVAGRTDAGMRDLVALAEQCEQAGASLLLLEAVTDQATQAVLDAVSIPVIGCGAGPGCHGYVVIAQDWLGQTDWQPSFATPGRDGGTWLRDAASAWAQAVRDRRYPGPVGPYPNPQDPSSTLA